MPRPRRLLAADVAGVPRRVRAAARLAEQRGDRRRRVVGHGARADGEARPAAAADAAADGARGEDGVAGGRARPARAARGARRKFAAPPLEGGAPREQRAPSVEGGAP